MYQRLLILLSVLFISGITRAQNVMDPTDGDYIYNSGAAPGSLTNPIVQGANVMQKWVHDPSQKNRIGSFQTEFKSYRWGNMSFRLRFPNGYVAGNKYPLIVFLHGAGEAAAISNANNSSTVDRENQDQLYWGAKLFMDSINNGGFNGFLLFPQLLAGANNIGTQWDVNTITPINSILDTLEKYNGLDPDRVITMGLSAGGLGTLKYAALYPRRIATVISAGPEQITDIIPSIDSLVQIPMYVTAGGIDVNPVPSIVLSVRDQITAKGANFYLGYYATLPHDTWESQWAQKNIYNRLLMTAYWNAASKAQPVLYYQNSQFCAGQPISATMGISANFYAYEWQRDGGSGFVTIPGATSNTYTATQAGSYRVHFKRTIDYNWSAWTPVPVVISTKICSVDTAFAEHFENSPVNDYVTFSGGPSGGNSPYFKNNTTCQNGLFVNGTAVFTQDASGRQGGKFMLNNTTVDATNCKYFAGDQVWRTYFPANVQPNTNYLLSFYMGNEATQGTANPTSPATQLVPKINNVALSAVGLQAVLVGNISWKKYSFVWNSGNNTSAEIAITNNITNGAGNDFALDEISLVKYNGPSLPGGFNPTLWSKAGSVPAYDGAPVSVWNNDDVNGNSLQQNSIGREPLFKNNGTDNVNFNPSIAYNSAANRFNTVTGGFSGNGTIHNAAHIYVVSKFSNVTTSQDLFYEGQGSGTLAVSASNNGIITWTAGNGTSVLSTASGVNEANKPILWTFSKDNINNTGNGNKQDIRKNGVVVKSTNNTSTFTGNNSNLTLGVSTIPATFNGNIAEIIYVLDSTITAAAENKIESYLAVKYGTTLGSTGTPVSYTASNNTVFWDGSATYQNDVFGIGTDSTSSLVQTISNSVNSGSGDGTGQSQKGNLVLSTGTTLADKSFLMIGNDAATLAQHTIIVSEAAAVAVGSTRVGREWKVNNTGGIGAVTLSFDTTGLGSQAGGSVVSNYALMVDNDGDGDFKTGTLTFFNATSASGKKIIFSNVTLNDNVVFTVITLKSSLLPAIWLGFTAQGVDGNALLNWKTSDEMNVDRYVVEHSFNGVSFATVGSVAANNSTGVNQYSFTHAGLAPGLHYYRIRRIDKDGKSDYTDTKTVKISTTGANVQVRPNPVVGSTLVLAVTVQQSSKTFVQVLSVDGKVMLQQSINLTAGNNLVNLNVSNVPTGIYLVQVQLADEVATKKFIRQR